MYGQKATEIGYDVKIEGSLVSFYPEDDFDISKLTKRKILDTWEVNSSLEEVYLNIAADKAGET